MEKTRGVKERRLSIFGRGERGGKAFPNATVAEASFRMSALGETM